MINTINLTYQKLFADSIYNLFALYRHSGMFLAGIHLNQRPKTWIPAKNMPE
jgi:hypothetical protein